MSRQHPTSCGASLRGLLLFLRVPPPSQPGLLGNGSSAPCHNQPFPHTPLSPAEAGQEVWESWKLSLSPWDAAATG